MPTAAYDINALDRARMLSLAKSRRWPRVWLSRRTQAGDKRDYVGPGIVPWYALAEQCSSDVVADATRALLEPTPQMTLPAAAAEERT